MAAFKQLPSDVGLFFRKGDSFSVEIDITPLSLEGRTVSATVVSAVNGGSIVSMESETINATDGRLNVSLTKEQTAALAAGTYRWQLVASDGNENRTYVTGFVEVKA